MEAAAVTIQQANTQLNMAVAVVKKQAQAERAIVDVLIQSSSANRGQNLDITV